MQIHLHLPGFSTGSAVPDPTQVWRWWFYFPHLPRAGRLGELDGPGQESTGGCQWNLFIFPAPLHSEPLSELITVMALQFVAAPPLAVFLLKT